MVATVLRLRYRILGNTLARRPWQLVGFCFGILWALGILALVISVLIGVSRLDDLEPVRAVAILGGSALLLGWIVPFWLDTSRAGRLIRIDSLPHQNSSFPGQNFVLNVTMPRTLFSRHLPSQVKGFEVLESRR